MQRHYSKLIRGMLRPERAGVNIHVRDKLIATCFQTSKTSEIKHIYTPERWKLRGIFIDMRRYSWYIRIKTTFRTALMVWYYFIKTSLSYLQIYIDLCRGKNGQLYTPFSSKCIWDREIQTFKEKTHYFLTFKEYVLLAESHKNA